jgi:2-keto-4-pentenoate hydratase
VSDPAVIRAAGILAAAYRRRRPIEALPDDVAPSTLLEAYAIQDRLVAGWRRDTVGWKLSCTSETARTTLGFGEPCRGQIVAGRVHVGPATLPASDYFMRLAEPEFGFRLAHDLSPALAPFDLATVTDAIESVIPVIEIVDTAYRNWTSVGVLSLIADNMLAGGVVLGRPEPDWRRFDLQRHAVTVSVNDTVASTGSGGNVMGNPLNALHWLANDLASVGRGLRAGDVVATGLTTGLVFADPGDAVHADFGELGTVDVTFSAD